MWPLNAETAKIPYIMTSESVLDYFKEIVRIPRESGHEEPMTLYLKQFAADRGLGCKVDGAGNVLISKPATKGREGVPTLVLQAHQDMVCEKVGGSAHDFSKDPVRYEIEDGWMVARETTLGADDGIGIAACLALLDSDVPTGALECLFTVSEETGMDGAHALGKDFISGKILINLDSEDEGQLFVGCAGGVDTVATRPYATEALRKGYKTVEIRMEGGIGGHSGDDIDKGRANMLQQLVRFLYTELQYDWQLVLLEGGNKPNAIVREAKAVIAVPSDEVSDTLEDVAAFDKVLKAEFSQTDPGVGAAAAPLECRMKPMAEDDSVSLITALKSCPHGVYGMSFALPGLVETSTNLASVKMSDGKIEVVTSQRSSVVTKLHSLAQTVEAVFLLAGFEVEHLSEYPGWEPDMDSPLLKACVESYRKLFSKDPEVKAIHAGLECGLLKQKFPDLDMISFGPTLRGVHAPGERLEMASLDKFVTFLNDIVTNYK